MSQAKHVSAVDFDSQVLRSEVPVLVDFYADWCGPCRLLAPALERLAKEYSGRAKIMKVNVDTDPELASKFNVSGIPMLAFFYSGQLVGRVEGLQSEGNLRNALNQLTTASVQSAV
jgi:thioredoxin 1